MKNFFVRYPLLSYFLIAFLFPWSLWSYLIATTPAGQLLKTGPTPMFLVFAILGGFGPSLAGFLVTGLVHGKSGMAQLWGGLKKGRFGIAWYGVSLFGVPLITLIGLWVASFMNPALTLGDAAGRLGLGLAWPFFSSLGEEFGWRGFALPRLLGRMKPVVAALAIGVLWGFWHLPADYLGIGDQGAFFFLNFLLLGPVLLTGLSVLMTWIYLRTRGSLLAMVLFHYSITFGGIVLSAQGLSGWPSVANNAILAGLVWTAAAAVLAAKGLAANR